MKTNTDHGWVDDLGHQLVLTEIDYRWRRSQKSTPAKRLFNCIFNLSRPEALYVQEYLQVDSVTDDMASHAVGCWRYDNQGLQAESAPTFDDLFYERFDRLIFCLIDSEFAIRYHFSQHGGFVDRGRVISSSGGPRLEVLEQWHF